MGARARTGCDYFYTLKGTEVEWLYSAGHLWANRTGCPVGEETSYLSTETIVTFHFFNISNNCSGLINKCNICMLGCSGKWKNSTLILYVTLYHGQKESLVQQAWGRKWDLYNDCVYPYVGLHYDAWGEDCPTNLSQSFCLFLKAKTAAKVKRGDSVKVEVRPCFVNS